MKPAVAKTFIFVGIPIALGILVLIYGALEFRRFLLTSPKFSAQTVEVLSKGAADKASVLELAGISPTANIFSLDLEQVKARVEKHPWVYSATVVRSLPNKIQITYISQEPVAILGAGSMYYLNRDGKPFYKLQKGDSLSYPLVQVEGSSQDSELLRSRVETSLKILSELKSSKIYDEKDLGDITIRLGSESGAAPYLLTLRFPPKSLTTKAGQIGRLYTVSFGQGDLPSQVKRWEAVVRHLVQQGKNPRLIRLELGKKVVVKVER